MNKNYALVKKISFITIIALVVLLFVLVSS